MPSTRPGSTPAHRELILPPDPLEADQAHLTGWYRTLLGVTPAAYRNSVQDSRR